MTFLQCTDSKRRLAMPSPDGDDGAILRFAEARAALLRPIGVRPTILRSTGAFLKSWPAIRPATTNLPRSERGRPGPGCSAVRSSSWRCRWW